MLEFKEVIRQWLSGKAKKAIDIAACQSCSPRSSCVAILACHDRLAGRVGRRSRKLAGPTWFLFRRGLIAGDYRWSLLRPADVPLRRSKV
jgi:hypothetical protein